MKAYSPTGSPILGTLENLSARCEITHDSFVRQPDGSLTFEWQGGTEMFYDDQVTVTRNGRRVFLAADGTDWTEDQLLFAESDEAFLRELLRMAEDALIKGQQSCTEEDPNAREAVWSEPLRLIREAIKDLDGPAVACAFCDTEHSPSEAEEISTHQQWGCLACGQWNDKEAA